MPQIAGNQPGPGRLPRDNYSTDPRWVHPLVQHVKLPRHIYEPASGDGALVRELTRRGHLVTDTDISEGTDFLQQRGTFAAIVTNPPYSLVDQFIEHGRELTDTLCLLLGWHLVGGGARRAAAIYRKHPPTKVIVVPQRMKVNGHSSQFNHAWVVWTPRWDMPDDHTELVWADAQEPT